MFGRKKIDFLVIGAQKCGTSSLYRYLTTNLMIGGPDQKELHYFDFFHARGRRWYHSHFNFKEANIHGEASPFYLLHPQVAMRAFHYNRHLKIIVILRNPVERAISHYRMNLSNHLENLPLLDALDQEEERLQQYDADQPDNALQNFSYLRRGLYAEQIAHWEKYFPANQITLINYHQFFSKPWQEVQKLYRFLGVAPFYGTESFASNTARAAYEPSSSEINRLEEFYREPNRQLAEKYAISFG